VPGCPAETRATCAFAGKQIDMAIPIPKAIRRAAVSLRGGPKRPRDPGRDAPWQLLTIGNILLDTSDLGKMGAPGTCSCPTTSLSC
jgi:hypothetical protein